MAGTAACCRDRAHQEDLNLYIKRNNILLMEWPVEYTDANGGIPSPKPSRSELMPMSASWSSAVPSYRFPIRAASTDRAMLICESCACRAEASHLRVFYAFDPRRMAILLIGGDKTGDRRFYEQMIPLADANFMMSIWPSWRRRNTMAGRHCICGASRPHVTRGTGQGCRPRHYVWGRRWTSPKCAAP